MSETNAGAVSASDPSTVLGKVMSHIYAGAAYVVKWAHLAELEWLSFKANDPALAGLIDEGASVARSEMIAHGVDAAAVDQVVNIAEQVGAAVEAMATHATSAVAASQAAPAPQQPGATARPVVAAAILLLGLGLASLGFGLAACTANPDGTVALSPAGQSAVNIACALDPAAFAVGQTASVVVPIQGVALAGSADAMLVHPLVTAGCAKYGMKPVAVVASPATPVVPVGPVIPAATDPVSVPSPATPDAAVVKP